MVEDNGREVDWINRFLDQERVRGVAEHAAQLCLRSAPFPALVGGGEPHHGGHREALAGSALLDYIRFQTNQQPRPAAASINRRVGIAERALRLAFPHVQLPSSPAFSTATGDRSRSASDVRVPALSRLRVRTPKRVIMPLSVDEVAQFWASFRTSRDLAIVGLMLFDGLRSCEVLALNRDDLILSEAQMRVRGKGNKPRCLPLAPEIIQLLDHYLRLERPPNCGSPLFVGLKGRARGRRMTAAGLRSLFRHHRQTTGVPKANPHRFRHTFATDMLRAGISLPALMQLMGHAKIQTTLVYVHLSSQDVYQQYARAVAQQIRRIPPAQS